MTVGSFGFESFVLLPASGEESLWITIGGPVLLGDTVAMLCDDIGVVALTCDLGTTKKFFNLGSCALVD